MRSLLKRGPYKNRLHPLTNLYKNKLHPKRRRTHLAIVLVFAIMLVGWGATAVYLTGQARPAPEAPCPVTYVNLTQTTVAKPVVVTPSVKPSVTTSAQVTPSPKPVTTLLYIMEDNCSVCEQQAPIIQAIAASGHTVNTVNLFNASGPAIVAQYNVTETPTMIVLNGNTTIARFVGLTTEAQILAVMY